MAVTHTVTKTATANNNGYHALKLSNVYAKNTQAKYSVPTSMMISDFNFNNETAILGGISYSFDNIGIEGLELSYTYTHGTGAKTKELSTGVEHKVTEHEQDITLTYNFTQFGLKDLYFKAGYGIYNNDEIFRLASNQGEAKNFRTWLTYSFSL